MIGALAIGVLALAASSDEGDRLKRLWYLNDAKGFAQEVLEQGRDLKPLLTSLTELSWKAETLDQLFFINRFIVATINATNSRGLHASSFWTENFLAETTFPPSRPIEWAFARFDRVDLHRLLRNKEVRETHQILNMDNFKPWDLLVGWDATRMIAASDHGDGDDQIAILPRPSQDDFQEFIDCAPRSVRALYEEEP
jgi:hypothetical protein